MPAVPAPAKVLVTGASGFIASHVVQTLLGEGYTVVGTVRSVSKGEYLKNLYNSDRFSYAIIEDIEKADAFDEVVKSGEFDAIEHTASPFHLLANDPSEMIGPAVQGTINVLKSAFQNGPKVKRVVITSSVAAILTPQPADPITGAAYTFTEADWNTASPQVVEEQGSKAPNVEKYSASKSLAERAAWDFISEHEKEGIKFDLVTINPPFVFGPVIHEVRDIGALNESNAVFRKALLTKQEDETPLTSASVESSTAYHGNFVDVRTVASAHTRALQKEEAGGNRFITSAGTFCWQDVYDELNKAGVPGIPKGFPGSQAAKRHTFSLQDGSKAIRILGIEYPSPQQTFVNTLNGLKTRFPKDF